MFTSVKFHTNAVNFFTGEKESEIFWRKKHISPEVCTKFHGEKLFTSNFTGEKKFTREIPYKTSEKKIHRVKKIPLTNCQGNVFTGVKKKIMLFRALYTSSENEKGGEIHTNLHDFFTGENGREIQNFVSPPSVN